MNAKIVEPAFHALCVVPTDVIRMNEKRLEQSVGASLTNKYGMPSGLIWSKSEIALHEEKCTSTVFDESHKVSCAVRVSVCSVIRVLVRGGRKPFTCIVIWKGCLTFSGMSHFRCRHVHLTI